MRPHVTPHTVGKTHNTEVAEQMTGYHAYPQTHGRHRFPPPASSQAVAFAPRPGLAAGHRPAQNGTSFPGAVREHTKRGIEAVRRARTNPLAVVALMLAAAGVGTFILAPIGAVLGHVAVRQIRRSGQGGANFARWAVAVGWSITGIGVTAAVLTVLVLLIQGSYYIMRVYDWMT